MKKNFLVFIVLFPIPLVSCISIPKPKDDDSILLVVNTYLTKSRPDVYKSAKMYLETNKDEKIPLRSGLNYIDGLKAGTLVIQRIYVEYENGRIASVIPIGKTVIAKPSSIIILKDKYSFEVYILKTTADYRLYSMKPEVLPVSAGGMERIKKDIEENDNYSLWQNGYTVE